MPKSPSITKVVYKPDTQSTDEFMIVVNPAQFKKWKLGDTSIPLADIVDSFAIFHSPQGSQGYLGRPSKQQLENIFGTSKDVEVIKAMLEKGKEHSGEGIHSAGTFSMNPMKLGGSAVPDSKGKV